MKHSNKEVVDQFQYRRKNIDSYSPVNTQNVAKKIKNYVFMLDDIIGKGSFSTVYRGQHQITHQVVAIKVIDLKRMQSSALTQLLHSEVQTLQSLDHPNILHCQDIYFSASNCYIVTEFCNGGDLKELLNKQGPLDEKTVSQIILQVYEGLKYLSSRNIVHRDFKATNVLISNGRIKIADFGFAKKTKQIFKDVTVGSPLCMSPQGIIENIYGPKTDVWAFGIFLYQILHGKNPFYFCQLQEQLKRAILEPITQANLRSSLSPELKRLILDCLQIDPDKRISIKQIQYTPFFLKIRQQKNNSQLIVSLVEQYKIQKQASIVSTQAPKSNQIIYRNHFTKQRRLQNNESPSKRNSRSKNYNFVPIKASDQKLHNLKYNKIVDDFPSYQMNSKNPNCFKDDKSIDSIQHLRSRSFNNRQIIKVFNKTLTTPPPQSKIKSGLNPVHNNTKMFQNIYQFKDIVSLLHYCRILFKTIKLCQKHVVLNIDAMTSWLFQFLNQVIQNINKISCPTSNTDELKRIAHQYYVRYDNQLIYTSKIIYTPSKIKNLIKQTLNILKISPNQNKRDIEISQSLRHLNFMLITTELLEKSLDSGNYKYFTQNNQIEEFLNSRSFKANVLRSPL